MAKKYRTVKVEVPEVETLGLDPSVQSALDSACLDYRSKQQKIKELEAEKDKVYKDRLRPIIDSLSLPDRVISKNGWDLRKTVRDNERLNIDKLKLYLMHQHIQIEAECQKVVHDENGNLQVCQRCGGVGVLHLEGLSAINYLFDVCTDHSQTTSWSVYGLTATAKDE